MYGGHAVALTGHGHPAVVEAIREQAGNLLFYSNLVSSDVRARAAERLAALAPPGLGHVFLCSTGTEANETALKIARRFTGRPRVVSFEGGFHGRTLGALSAVGLPGYRDGVGPVIPDHDVVPFGDLDAVGAATGPETAAVLIEPVQSMGGVRVADPAFYRGLRDITRDAGALLVFDEVQTAPGRTGHPFVGVHWDVVPDLIATAKGLASGLPCGATLVREDVAATIGFGEQGTTFGGAPLVMAAMEATLRVLVEEDLCANATRQGERIAAGARDMPGVEEIRGLGLLRGIRVDRPAKEVVRALFDAGVLAGGTPGDPNVIRLLPPLTLRDAETDLFLEILREVLS
jgi:acetylornithine aminotransferase/acetylornithine/N-succinyldiaminopimelate aminotransferase